LWPHDPSYAATVAHRLTTLMLVLVIVFGGFTAIQAVRGGHPVAFDATTSLDDNLLPKGVYATTEQRTGIAVKDPTRREERLAALVNLVPLLLGLAILALLRGIARSVRDGDPFVAVNVRRLRAIGALLILGVVALHFAETALRDALLDPYRLSSPDVFTEPGLRPPDRDFDESPPLFGLGVFVLAQVFAHGTRLREYVAATI